MACAEDYAAKGNGNLVTLHDSNVFNKCPVQT